VKVTNNRTRNWQHQQGHETDQTNLSRLKPTSQASAAHKSNLGDKRTRSRRCAEDGRAADGTHVHGAWTPRNSDLRSTSTYLRVTAGAMSYPCSRGGRTRPPNQESKLSRELDMCMYVYARSEVHAGDRFFYHLHAGYYRAYKHLCGGFINIKLGLKCLRSKNTISICT
jgi:hypothetical protein